MGAARAGVTRLAEYRFGLLSAAVGIATMLTTVPLIDAADHRTADLAGYSAMVVSALLVYFGIRSHRDRVTPARRRSRRRPAAPRP